MTASKNPLRIPCEGALAKLPGSGFLPWSTPVISRATVVSICLVTLWLPAAHTAEFNAEEVLKAASRPLDESPAKEIASIPLGADFKRVAISADGKSVLAFGDGF